MRLAVIGSRGYPLRQLVREYVEALPPETVLVTGGWPQRPGGYHVVEATAGVDREAYQAAESAGLVTVLVAGSRAKWGRHAGVHRNPTIVELAEALVAFWDMRSPGTRGTLGMAFEAPHLQGRIRVFGPDGQEVARENVFRGGR